MAIVFLMAFWLGSTAVWAGVIIAQGQGSTPGQNFYYSIPTTGPNAGIATQLHPDFFANPSVAGLAGGPNGQIYGIRSGVVGLVDPTVPSFTALGPAGPGSTGFDIFENGQAFATQSVSGGIQLYSVDLTTGSQSPIGTPFSGFVIGLGSVGGTLYGVNTTTNTLVSIDTTSGTITNVGNGINAPSGFSGFAALTGVDENGDGFFDALYGGLNFGPGSTRVGQLVRYDLNPSSLTFGELSFVGPGNPGLIYLGFASTPVPEPATVMVALFVVLFMATRQWRPLPGNPQRL